MLGKRRPSPKKTLVFPRAIYSKRLGTELGLLKVVVTRAHKV